MDAELIKAVVTAQHSAAPLVTYGQGGIMTMLGVAAIAFLKEDLKSIFRRRNGGNGTYGGIERREENASGIRSLERIEMTSTDTKEMMIKLSESTIAMQTSMVGMGDSLRSIDTKLDRLPRP